MQILFAEEAIIRYSFLLSTFAFLRLSSFSIKRRIYDASLSDFLHCYKFAFYIFPK